MTYAYVALTIANPESLAAYRARAAEALAAHGGSVVSASRDLVALEGAPTLPDMAAILSFPDRAAAEAWINDPAFADIHALRRGAGQSDIILLG
ncbi:Uncharacterized conserved protein, DUF1330 family [Roseovarius azorensis]|uniref:Uncharacterized conserved protein, DUF1330 family n=1 Tax=Roseovarius azorensis TaxID=1287727 RepID=A0A1H7R6L4_9RHOB|nr:DUF1330 domain-containing protein [Roseovarius azorensis]SEL55871.1 Uncharacterized conserved protein, DUF1330 family [Roseovarius azorensis]